MIVVAVVVYTINQNNGENIKYLLAVLLWAVNTHVNNAANMLIKSENISYLEYLLRFLSQAFFLSDFGNFITRNQG